MQATPVASLDLSRKARTIPTRDLVAIVVEYIESWGWHPTAWLVLPTDHDNSRKHQRDNPRKIVFNTGEEERTHEVVQALIGMGLTLATKTRDPDARKTHVVVYGFPQD
jgi:hypothetical protein